MVPRNLGDETTAAIARATPRWIRGPAWDLALMSFCWVPHFLWLIFGLHLGEGGGAIVARPQFQTALLVTLGLIFVHRQYVFVMVLGDRATFRQRPWSFIAAPTLIVGTTIAAYFAREELPNAWIGVFVAGTVWNIWHTIMQRFGLLRMYAGRAGGGLQSREHARREFALIWSSVLFLSVAIATTRTETLRGHPVTESILAQLRPILIGPAPKVALIVSGLVFTVFMLRWGKHEIAATLTWNERLPRVAFLLSTLGLLVILYVFGPIVGYLTFASAHAIEYIAFVHHFAGRKFGNVPASERSLAARLLRNPLASAAIVVPCCFALYAALRTHGLTLTPVFIIYEVSAAMVHFAYDGWVWKTRDASVARPLGLTSA